MNSKMVTKYAKLNSRWLLALPVLIIPVLGIHWINIESKGEIISSAQNRFSRPWTAVGSTGAIDESSRDFYAFGSSDLGFKSTDGTTIVARYNVTNTFDNNADPNRPGWQTLRLHSSAPPNCLIQATIYAVYGGLDKKTALCTAENAGAGMSIKSCALPPQTDSSSLGVINFASYFYYVEVTIDRIKAPTAKPSVFGVSLN